MTLLQKLKNYWAYRQIVNRNIDRFIDPALFAMRVDALGRMYTVINIPPDVPAYGPDLVVKEVEEYIRKTSREFIRIGLFELASVYAIQKLNESNYLVVYGYKFMDPRSIAKGVQYIITGLCATAAAGGLVYFLSHV